jgi:CBS domain-containing protein
MRRALSARTVSEIMNRTPVTVRPDLTVREVARFLEAERRDEVPVLDAEGLLCGVVSAVDLLRALRPDAAVATASPRAVSTRSIESVMRPGVISVEPGDPILAAADLMVGTRFHMLPVVQRGIRGPLLVGVVERRDVLGALWAPARPRRKPSKT